MVIYILYVWTVVAMAGDRHYQERAWDWRPIGEFQDVGRDNGLARCEAAAKQLGLKSEQQYRCVRAR